MTVDRPVEGLGLDLGGVGSRPLIDPDAVTIRIRIPFQHD
jgi:hypothetical protein